MTKKFIYSLILIVVLFSVAVLVNYFNYKNYQKELLKDVSVCSVSNDDYYDAEKGIINCYTKMYELAVPHLLVNKAFSNKRPLALEFLLPSYMCPKIALEKSDALMGYGVFRDIDAEIMYSNSYDKPSYAFDCGISDFKITNKLCHFESSCIGTDEFILKEENQISSGKIHTFGQKLKELGLEDKKVFIKMDIAGAEAKVLPDILKYSDNITGMSICFHFKSANQIYKNIEVIKKLKENFVLVARADHSYRRINKKKCKYVNNSFAEMVVLSFVNKNLINKYYIDWNQTSIQTYNPELNIYINYEHEMTSFSKIIVIDEKINEFIKDSKKNKKK